MGRAVLSFLVGVTLTTAVLLLVGPESAWGPEFIEEGSPAPEAFQRADADDEAPGAELEPAGVPATRAPEDREIESASDLGENQTAQAGVSYVNPAEPALVADGPPSLDELVSPARPSEAVPALRRMEGVFAEQEVDPEWAALMEARILTEISAVPGLEVITLEVTCRSTLCRVELTGPVRLQGPNASEIRPGFPAFAIAETLGLEPRLVLGAANGYGTPMIVGFYGRRDVATTQSQQVEQLSV